MIGEAARVVEQTERDALAAGGVVLRYGFLSGPGTWYAHDSAIAALVRRRRFPMIGKGAGVYSFVHVEDAASATVAALDAPSGIYNVADDDPAPTATWLPAFAAALGAKPPLRVPRPCSGSPAPRARHLAGVPGGRGAARARRRSSIGHPSSATWRTGFRDP